MKQRHFVPFVLVLGLLCALVALAAAPLASANQQKWLFLPILVVVFSHLLIGFVVGIQVALREKSFVALLLPLVFISFHVSYGVGTLWAILRNAHAPCITGSQHIRESYI